MPLWLRHILICSAAAAGIIPCARVEAAFLPPQLETASMSSPATPRETPRDAPRPERVNAAVAASASMTGVGFASTAGGVSGQFVCAGEKVSADVPLFVSRLKLARESVEPRQGFLLDIMRPPRV